MLNQLRYFQAVVECHSFTEAAERCHISQSAISQQVQALEAELGVKLLNRQKRKFSLTEAGEYFYRKTVILVADYERIERETKKIAEEGTFELKVGTILTYGGEELQKAVAEFAAKYPSVGIRILTGTHEELRNWLENGQTDISLSDQRRALSSDAVNVILRRQKCWIEIAKNNPLSRLAYLQPRDLRNLPCLLPCTPGEEYHEKDYYSSVFGFEGEYRFVSSIKEARMAIVANEGFMPVDGEPVLSHFGDTIARVPFYRTSEQFERNLCLFWLKDNSGYYVEDFAEMLEKQFKKGDK